MAVGLSRNVRRVLLFFFSSRRRHTRYIGDWSSDVCSSDLETPQAEAGRRGPIGHAPAPGVDPRRVDPGGARTEDVLGEGRSEERRVGKECRCRWWGYG